MLPARPPVFHGRNKELERLVAQVVVPSTAPLGIIGPGGIGKTTLAMKVLHEPRVKQLFGRERFFLTCESANTPEEVLSQLASKLEVQISHDKPLWTAVLDSLRSRKRILLLLDNFESIWSTTNEELRKASEAFLAQLTVLDEVTLLVTTRGNILPEAFTWANSDTAELDTLSSTAAHQTFNDLTCLKPHILAAEPEAKALTDLLREIDFMPLAITLLARLDYRPSLLLREWSEHYTAVLEADHHDGTSRELSVEVSIKISLSHLPIESAEVRPRQLLSVLGQLPAGLFSGVSTELRSIIPNLDLAAQDLLRHSLAYTGGDGELRMLSPVRHYVSACIPMTPETLSAVDDIYTVMARTCPDIKRIGIDGPSYDVELPNLFHVLATGLDRHSDSVPVTEILDLAAYCAVRNQPCLRLLQKLVPRVEHSPSIKACAILAIAVQYNVRGELDPAVRYFEQSAELFAKLEDKTNEATARGLLSTCFTMLGRPVDADIQKAKFQALERESQSLDFSYLIMPGEDLVIAEQRFRNDRAVRLQSGDGFAVAKLSDLILSTMREQGTDIAAYTKELELVVALGEQTQPGSGPLWLGVKKTQLARQYLGCGNVGDAEELLIDAYALMSSTNYTHGQASVTVLLATLHKKQHRFSEAAELLEAAARLFSEVGDTNSAAECNQEASRTRMRAETSE